VVKHSAVSLQLFKVSRKKELWIKVRFNTTGLLPPTRSVSPHSIISCFYAGKNKSDLLAASERTRKAFDVQRNFHPESQTLHGDLLQSSGN
jgi:hypothetical protein